MPEQRSLSDATPPHSPSDATPQRPPSDATPQRPPSDATPQRPPSGAAPQRSPSERQRVEETANLARARALLRDARSVTVLTGAGISTASGIPDFRGPEGEWTKEPDAELLSTLSAYLGEDRIRERAWARRAASPVWRAQPNPAHLALVELERRGTLRALVTQNTDGLHQMAGHDASLVVEMHGNERTTRCESCGAEQPTPAVLRRIADGDPDPRCDECGGILRVTTILFEEALPQTALDRAIEAASECDVFLALGTTLTVFPVAGLVPLAARCGASVLIANAEPTPYDDLAAVVLRGDLADVVPRLVDDASEDTSPRGINLSADPLGARLS